jgi:hypothetical protein
LGLPEVTDQTSIDELKNILITSSNQYLHNQQQGGAGGGAATDDDDMSAEQAQRLEQLMHFVDITIESYNNRPDEFKVFARRNLEFGVEISDDMSIDEIKNLLRNNLRSQFLRNMGVGP